ncbi:MAG TPA: fasciclin domain-containing protein [Geobacteraceae bacterium]|nr:fasciclin domain-containing protein [Geobacteraceae bacterium]
MQDIFSTLSAEASMQTLVKAIEKAGMTEILKGAGPYTLFAPDDAAFSRMNVESMLSDPASLKSVLTYHLVSGKQMVNDIGQMETIATENGKSLTVAMDEGEIVVDNGKFVKPDIECSNGVVHIIDNVFQPQLSGWYREE